MGETEWKHAGWVSTMGKWAWIVLFIMAVLGLIVNLATTIPVIIAWQNAKAAWEAVFPTIPYSVPMPIGGLIWRIIAAVISIFISLFIIRPKFSKPCGEKDWEALYGWTLKLGSLRVPWMFIWGIIYVIFGWIYITAILIILPACMLIFAGPRKYDWKA